ncbi:ubiquitin carboxyl-terminal hydrolase 19 isoform X2, partial [Ixodes scapularis]
SGNLVLTNETLAPREGTLKAYTFDFVKKQKHSVNVFQPPVKSNKCALDAPAGTPPGSVEPLEAELDEAEGLDPGSNEGGPMFGVTSVVPYAESCPSKVDFVFEDR